MATLFANNGDSHKTSLSVASDLGLYCLPITLLWVSRLQWVNGPVKIILVMMSYLPE